MSFMWIVCEWILSYKLDDVKIYKFDDVFIDFCYSILWFIIRWRICLICKNDIVKFLVCGLLLSLYYELYYDDSEYICFEFFSFVSFNIGLYFFNCLLDVEEGREVFV